jgi:transcriptional regulator MraZ
MFRGNHPAKIDEKGRLKIPAAFKALVDAQNITQFFVTSTNGGKRAEIWPLPEWEKIEERLAKESSLDDAVEEYQNMVNFYGQQVEMDNQGRMLLPPILRAKAKLDAEVAVLGKGLHIEVYNLEIFEKEMPADGMSDERRKRVAEILSRQ